MAERLTTDWTETAEEAFGETGVVGESGEVVVKGILESLGLEDVQHYPSDKKLQLEGKDLSFTLDGELCWVDVKNNLHHGKDVCIDWPKLKKSKATYWIHINRKDPTDWVIYSVARMVNHLENKRWRELHWLTREEVESI